MNDVEGFISCVPYEAKCVILAENVAGLGSIAIDEAPNHRRGATT
jgi:hypothetical protein